MRTTYSTSTSAIPQRKAPTFRTGSLLMAIAFSALLLARAKLTQAQDSATQLPPQEDTLQIAAREQELRRKEEELLQAMRNAEVGSKPKAAGDLPVETVVAPETAVEKVSVSRDDALDTAVDSALHGDEHQELRALEQHPALVTKKIESPKPRSIQSATIKTHVVEDQPDGTTARRLGTYTRVNRDDYQWPSARRETSPTHTVTLSDIQREASVRSVSLAHEEVATIRNSSTHLRTGPSRLDTNLLALPQYSEVSIDYRSGSWYRVKTARGIRGWVPGNSLLFDAGISPRSAVRIGAVRGKVR